MLDLFKPVEDDSEDESGFIYAENRDNLLMVDRDSDSEGMDDEL